MLSCLPLMTPLATMNASSEVLHLLSLLLAPRMAVVPTSVTGLLSFSLCFTSSPPVASALPRGLLNSPL